MKKRKLKSWYSDELKDVIKILNGLLDDPQPSLLTWNEAVRDQMKKVRILIKFNK